MSGKQSANLCGSPTYMYYVMLMWVYYSYVMVMWVPMYILYILLMWVPYIVLMWVYYLYVMRMWVYKISMWYITISMFLVVFQLFIAYVGFATHIFLCGSMWVYVDYVGFRHSQCTAQWAKMSKNYTIKTFCCPNNHRKFHFCTFEVTKKFIITKLSTENF